MEQLVARWAHNPKVVSSSLAPATEVKPCKNTYKVFCLCKCSLNKNSPQMNYTVYILYSPQFNKHYVGFTSDLHARLLSHNSLATKGFTVRYRPWTLIHTEVFETKAEAMQKEKWFKSGVGRAFIKSLPH
jgi:putative endonuclease